MPEVFDDDNLDDFGELFWRAMNRRADALDGVFTRAFKLDGLRWQESMTESISGPLVLSGGKAPTEKLASRQGQSGLRGSFGFAVTGTKLDDIELRKFSTSPYAAVHELGTKGKGGKLDDIVPKNAGALTIPLEAAMTASGVPREPSARNYPDTFVLKTDRLGSDGKPRAFIVRKDGDQLEFLYMLASRVSIPARLGMNRTHVAQAPKRIKSVRRLLQKALAPGGPQ